MGRFWCQAGHGRQNAVAKLNESLAQLMLSYVDLFVIPLPIAVPSSNILSMYLMHSPGSPGPGRAESWAGMQVPFLIHDIETDVV
jgi:hypothetical protein